MSDETFGPLVDAALVLTGTDRRTAAVRVADQIGREHPHPLDDLMPRLAGKQLAEDPIIRAGLRELLDALGLNNNTHGGTE